MRRPRPLLAAAVALILSTACADQMSPIPADPEAPLPDALLGAAAFRDECASCHASGDGVDLAFFAFPDSTIVRRAVAHVDTATALDIVAHIGTIRAPRGDRHLRLFQPGDGVLDDDVGFALGVFGVDAWPTDLTTDVLLAIDPLDVSVAVAMPEWSVEESNVDWMPDQPLPDHILDLEGGLPRAMLEGYRAAPTAANLERAVAALRLASRRPAHPDAACITDDPLRADYFECFEVQRWISTLGAQHMVREGMDDHLLTHVHDSWWDVGQTVRRSIVLADIDFENGAEIWASWMYLGWMFEPGNHASVYSARGLVNVGLPRHATFLTLRSQVARRTGSAAPYDDVHTAARFAPPHWTFEAVRFGYVHLLERIDRGEVVRPDQLADAIRKVTSSYRIAQRKVTPDQAAELEGLGRQVLDGLGQM